MTRLGAIKDEVSVSPLYNEDLAPTEPEERTWTTYNIAALWIGMAVVFVVAALVLLLVPGPVDFYVVARGGEGGRSAGLVSCLGIEAGTLVHTAFATVGLSVILASSGTAFAVVKWMGVAYLVWLGLQKLLAPDDGDKEIAVELEPLPRVFEQGLLVQVLNPKVALFFLAFLPQFVDPSRGPVWSQILVLGATLAVLCLLTDGLYSLASGTVGGWLGRRSAGFRRGQCYVSGVYLALGVTSAVSGTGKD